MLSLIMVLSFVIPVLAEGEIEIEWIEGPQRVDIGTDLAQLELPEGYLFANGDDAKEIMEYFGNPPTGQEKGIVYSEDEQEDWFILFEYDPMGYVKDDESKNLDADKILENIKEGDKEANKKREEMGVPPLEVVGWEEPPHYDSVTHNLVWSLLAQSDGYNIINYNMKILGRHGIMSVTLVADPEEMTTVKQDLEKIISNFSYKEGNRYTDYIPGKDKAAEVGLTALIAGGAGAAATKVGLFAKLLLIFKKVWILLAAGVVTIFSKIRGKKKKKIQEDNINLKESNDNPPIETAHHRDESL